MDNIHCSPEKDTAQGDESIVKDGAWSPERAPISVLLNFLQAIQENDVTNAEICALKIIAVEPNNELVPELLSALKQHQALMSVQQSDDEASTSDECADAADSQSNEDSD
uniref:AlNc14C5G780 protein n=1 Tax=Albugo laibachii Nc14 TaxID=890382 RepID=F0W100_9STRA|nr:AlNc14C5G780 [Albugo laibachii Nc14]|eukprot:CCA14724.1 AlNc14C5G780 [Albugo laibachii Nc14]